MALENQNTGLEINLFKGIRKRLVKHINKTGLFASNIGLLDQVGKEQVLCGFIYHSKKAGRTHFGIPEAHIPK